MKQSLQRGNVVDVVNLKMYFSVTRGLFKRKVAEVKALDGVSFSIKPGETLGLVGESGCGKTTVGRCLIRLYKPSQGIILFKETDITNTPERKLSVIRRQMSMVFQDPYSSLNPKMNSAELVGEPLRIYRRVKNEKDFKEQVAQLFVLSGLSPDMMDRFPHEFSGGQRQRLSIARALAGDPSLVICDEPISALDVSMQAQILGLLKDLQQKNKELSYLFISHDLLAVQYISDRVAVMYLGRIVEIGDAQDIYNNTLHPYSQALLSAQPIPDPVAERERERIILSGTVPTPLNPPSGCTFHTRCPYAMPECTESAPELRDMGNGHCVACHKVH